MGKIVNDDVAVGVQLRTSVIVLTDLVMEDVPWGGSVIHAKQVGTP